MIGGSLDKAFAQWQAGNINGAKREIFLILGEEPQDIDALSLLTQCFLAENNMRDALSTINQVLGLDTDNAPAWRLYGMVRLHQGNTLAAIDAFEKALSLDPQDGDTFLTLAELHAGLGKTKTANEYFDKALAFAPDNAEALIAYALWARDNNRPYRDKILRALEIAPEARSVNLAMAELALDEGKAEEAKERALWLLSSNSEDKAALHVLVRAKAARNPILWIWARWDRFWRSMTSPAKIACAVTFIIGFFVMRWMLALTGLEWLVNSATLVALLTAGLCLIGDNLMEVMVDGERKKIALRDDF